MARVPSLAWYILGRNEAGSPRRLCRGTATSIACLVRARAVDDSPSRANSGSIPIMSAYAATLQDVQAAAERIRGIAHRTPVMTSETLDRLAGRHIFVKCENLQKSGSFKY